MFVCVLPLIYERWTSFVQHALTGPLGRPNSVKKITNTFYTVVTLMFLRGIAPGNRVVLHIMVKIYSHSDLVLGSLPAHSVMTGVKAVSATGIG